MTLLSNVFELAQQPGAAHPPAALVALVGQSPDAAERDIWAALEIDLRFIRVLGAGGAIQQGMSDWAELIRWLKAEVATWSTTPAPSVARLKAILAFAQWMDPWGDCWEEMARAVTPSAQLIANLHAAAAAGPVST